MLDADNNYVELPPIKEQPKATTTPTTEKINKQSHSLFQQQQPPTLLKLNKNNPLKTAHHILHEIKIQQIIAKEFFSGELVHIVPIFTTTQQFVKICRVAHLDADLLEAWFTSKSCFDRFTETISYEKCKNDFKTIISELDTIILRDEKINLEYLDKILEQKKDPLLKKLRNPEQKQIAKLHFHITDALFTKIAEHIASHEHLDARQQRKEKWTKEIRALFTIPDQLVPILDPLIKSGVPFQESSDICNLLRALSTKSEQLQSALQLLSTAQYIEIVSSLLQDQNGADEPLLKALLENYPGERLGASDWYRLGCSEEQFKTIINNACNLKKLNLANTKISLDSITLPKTVEDLILRETEGVTDTSLKSALQYCSNLKTLDLRSLKGISLEGIVFPPSLETLNLHMHCNKQITHHSLEFALQKCVNLKDLDIGYLQISLEASTLPVSLVSLKLTENEQISKNSLNAVLQKLNNLTTLDLSYTSLPVDEIDVPESVETLSLGGHKQLSNDTLKRLLEKCKNLKKLNLGNTDISLEGITFPVSLEEIDLHRNEQIMDNFLQSALQPCKQLKALYLGDSVALQEISFPPSLEILDIAFNKHITDTFLRSALRKCKNLKVLHVKSTKISLNGISLPESLQELSICYSHELTDNFLRYALQKCEKLRILRCICARISFQEISLPPSLEELNATATDITNASLNFALQKCNHLKTLVISLNHKIKLEGAILLESLETLELYHTFITNEALRLALQKYKNLKKIDLSRTYNSLKDVSFPPSLEVLRLVENYQVTDDLLKLAVKKCQSLTILDVYLTNITYK